MSLNFKSCEQFNVALLLFFLWGWRGADGAVVQDSVCSRSGGASFVHNISDLLSGQVKHWRQKSLVILPSEMWNFDRNSTCTRQKSCGMRWRDPEWRPEEKTEEVPSPLVRQLIAQVPVFALTSRSIGNDLCRKHSQLLVRSVRQFKLWALKMHDSSAKTPSGLLNGNVNQFGDFDQCLSVSGRGDAGNSFHDIYEISGKYCLAYLDVRIKPGYQRGILQDISDLAHSYDAITSHFDDPGHRIPRFSTINWGFCIPSSCTAGDLERGLQESLLPYNNGTELSLKVRVEPGMCYVQDDAPFATATLVAMGFFLSILFITFLGTVSDICRSGSKSGQGNAQYSLGLKYLEPFSLRKNIGTLLDTRVSEDDIQSVHGIRAINALALLIFHKSAAFQYNPYVNRTAMQESLSGDWSIIGRTSSIYTDSFILLSGLLTSYGLVKDLDRNQKINVLDKVWTRYIRFTPNLLAVILFCTYVMVHLGSGPQWNLVVQHHSDICQENMWRNFLYIHNYYGFETMCLTHTHQLGIDMQLFLVAPIFVYLLWRSRWAGLVAMFAVSAVSTFLRYTVTYSRNLSTVVYFGISVSQLFDTSDYSYILPSHRISTYLLGVGLGYFIRKTRVVKLNKGQVTVGWLLAIGCAVLTMCGPYHMARRGYLYDPKDAALYNAFSPFVWGFFVTWAILASQFGYGGFLSDFLCWRGFVVFTRIAYGVYLTQFPIFFYNVGTTRTASYYRPHMLFEVAEIGCILLASTMLTLLFDLPAQELKKLLWSKRTRPETRSPTKLTSDPLVNEDQDFLQRMNTKG